MESDLMNGGPVGHFDGEYVNGHSTNGTTSPSTPGFHDHDHDYDDRRNPNPKRKLFSTEEIGLGARADTWPQSPPPAIPAQLGPKAANNKAHATNGRHPTTTTTTASHSVPPPELHEGGTGGRRSRAHARVKTDVVEGTSSNAKYPRISRPVELMRSSYDCVVIGSGYGGAVAASRAARAGEEVCVLELGKERWPGEYPIDSGSALEDLHFSGTVSKGGLFKGINVDEGDPTGMYHLIFGKGQNAVVCNGE